MKHLRSAAATASALLLAAITVFAFSTPAQAQDVVTNLLNWSENLCAAPTGLGPGYAVIQSDCSNDQIIWKRQERGTSPSGHTLVKFQSYYNNGCLDSGGGGNGASVQTVPCNTGDYQLWEVFPLSQGNTVYKSWGAWTNQGHHLCLSTFSSYVDRLETCDLNAASQRWSRG